MRRFCLYCLFSLPILVYAETNEQALIPEPPNVSAQSQSAAPLEGSAPPATETVSTEEPKAVPEPPDLPMPIRSGEHLDPDITIVRKGQETIQEYRENGVLYMVKIIPDVGPAYYWIDSNGDGKLDVKKSDLDKGLNVNMWKVFEWK